MQKSIFDEIGNSIFSKASQLGSNISQGFQQLRQPTQPRQQIGQTFQQLAPKWKSNVQNQVQNVQQFTQNYKPPTIGWGQPIKTTPSVQIRVPERLNVVKQFQALPQLVSQTIPKITTPPPFVGGLAKKGLQQIQPAPFNLPFTSGLAGHAIKTAPYFVEGLPSGLEQTKAGIKTGVVAMLGRVARSIEKNEEKGQYGLIRISPESLRTKSKALLEGADINMKKSAQGLQDIGFINDQRTFIERIKDPKWLGHFLGVNAPNTLVSLGVAVPASLVGFAVGGPPGAVAAGTSAAGAMSYTLESGFAYQDAKQFGANDELAENISAIVGVGNAALEMTGVGALLKRLSGIPLQTVKRTLVKEMVKGFIEQTAIEAPTEGLQEVWSNAWARTYDQHRNLLAGVPEAMLAGGIFGGVTGGVGPIITTAYTSIVQPPTTNIQPREIISVKSKYEGVQTANAVVRPDGTGSLAVELKPEAQGKGLGTELVKELETILKDKGVTQVEIASVPESIGFWEKQGYVQTGQPAQAGLVNMQKALEPEPTGLKLEPEVEKQITIEEAKQAMGTLFSNEEIQFLTRGAKDIVTPDGKLAMGKTVGSVVEVVENRGKVSEKTVYHEGFHAYTQNFADPNLKQGAIDEAKTQQGFKTDQEAEEWLADSFADFMGARQTFTGRILSFFTNLWYSIRSFIGKVRQSEQLFRDIIDRKRPTAAPEVTRQPVEAFRKYPEGQEPVVINGFFQPEPIEGEPNFYKDLRSKFPFKLTSEVGDIVGNTFDLGNGVKVELTAYEHSLKSRMIFETQNPKIWYITRLTSTEKGAGNASKALDQLISLADKYGITLRLEPTPYGKEGLTKEQLTNWYSNKGFRQLGESRFLEKLPLAPKPAEEIVEPEEIPEVPTTPIVKTPAPQDVVDQIVENIGNDPISARETYNEAIKDFDLPTFEELEQTASQVVRAELEIVDELKQDALENGIARIPDIAQYSNVIRKSVRIHNLLKASGKEDITSIMYKVPKLDRALDALKERGVEINDMEELAEFAKGLPKKETIRVSKSKATKLRQLITAGATPEQLLSELESPMSPTRQAIRVRITRGISSEKVGASGQLRYYFDEAGEPLLTEKTSFSLARKGISPELSKEIPIGQKIIPGTGVIHPKVMERLVTNQVRKLRELRRRSGIKGKEFTRVIQQVTGKKTVTGLTYQEGQNLIDLMSPPQRKSLMGIVENIRTSQGDEKAQIIGNAILNIKNTSPLEEKYGLNKIFARGLEAVANMQNRLPSLPPLVSPPKGKKGAIMQLYRTALSLPWVLLDTSRAAKFAGIFREVVAPIRAINNLAYDHVANNYRTGMLDAIKSLPKEGQTGVVLKLNGFSNKIIQQKIGRSLNEEEKGYIKYFQEVEDNLFTFINATRQLGNKKPMPYRKNHWPWILSQEVAEAMGAVVRGKAHLPRMMSKDAYLAGLFENNPEKVVDSRANALAYHTSNNLVDGLMKDRLSDAGKVGVAAKMVADLVEARVVRRTDDAISRIENAIGDAVDGVLGAFFYRTEKISPELQTELKKTDFYNDPDNKEMIDAGELRLNQFKMPNVIGRARDLIYLNLIGIKNFLFFPVNLTQTMIGIPFAGTQNWVKAYGDLANTYLRFNKTNAKKLERVLNDYNVMSLQGEPIAEGKINRLWRWIMKWGMATVVLSENINRPVSLFQGQYRTKEAAKQLGIELTQEEIEGGGAGLARDVEVVGGPGYAALATNSQLVGLMYQFSRFPIQMVDNMLTMAQRIFSKKKSAEMMQAHFIENPWGRAESIEAFEKDWEKLNMHEKREFAMGTMIMLGVLGTLSVALTGSLVLLKRYAPFTTWLPNTNPIPLQLLQSAKEALSGDPEQIERLRERLNSFFNPLYFRRANDGRQIMETGYITNDKGQVMYKSPEGEDKGLWGWRVLFSGRSILPDYQQREQLYKKGLEQSKDRYERTKTFNDYVSEAERISKEQGLDAANNYLLSLPLETKEDLDKLNDIMEERELQKGITFRQYQNLSSKPRAEAMYDELRGLDAQKHQGKLNEWFEQKLLNEETMIELQKIFENPPEPSFMEKIFYAVNKLIGVKDAEAAAPKVTLLSTLQQRKLDQQLKLYSPNVQEAMKLSESYKNIKSLEEKYGGTSFGNALIEKEMKVAGITEPQYQYAQLTELTDDLQYEEVSTRLEGLEGEEKLTTMSAMRVKSPYTRKALLTDTLINKMEKEGSIDETTADFLKDLDWDIKTQDFKKVAPKKAKKITFPKLSFKKVSTPKPTQIKITRPQQFKPLQIKIGNIPKPPSVRFTSSQFSSKMPTVRFPKMPTYLSGIGRTA